jgi:hypothetical protein
MISTSEIATFEANVEQLCQQIVKTDAECWDVRNRAINKLTSVISNLEGSPHCNTFISLKVYRSLRDPIISMVSRIYKYTFFLVSSSYYDYITTIYNNKHLLYI